jgi:hypothetical protein
MKAYCKIGLVVCAVLAMMQVSPLPAQAAAILNQPSLGFSIAKPDDWRETRDSAQGTAVIQFTGPVRDGKPPPRLIIQVIKPSPPPELTELADELVGRWSSLPRFELLKKQGGNFGGQPAVRMAWLYLDKSGHLIRREQFVVHRQPFFYLIAYTAAAVQFNVFLPAVDRAVNSFKFHQKTSGAQKRPISGNELDPRLGTLMFGDTLAKNLGGPYFAPRYQNNTAQGSLAAAHLRDMVARLADILTGMAAAQERVLGLYDRSLVLQAKLAVLLDRFKNKSGGSGSWLWQKEKQLFGKALRFRLMQKGQQGAVAAAIKGLPGRQAISGDLAAIQTLALVQQAVSDQQALILLQLEQVLIPSYVLHGAMTQPESGLPLELRRELTRFYKPLETLMPQTIGAAVQTIGHARQLSLGLALIKDFDRQLAAAYARAIRGEIPRLKAALSQAKSAGLDQSNLAMAQVIYSILKKISGAKPASSSRLQSTALFASLAGWLIRPAYAGGYGKRVRQIISSNRRTWQANIKTGLSAHEPLLKKVSVDMPPVKVLKAAGSAIRHSAGAIDYVTQQASNAINYSLYSPLRVNYQGRELTSDPKLARLHDVRTQNDFMAVVKKTNEELGSEYLRGEFGVGALTRGVEAIDSFGKVYITGEAAYSQTTGQLMPAGSPGVLGFLGGVAYGVVSDVPKAVMVLSNPKTSRNEKIMATVDLVMATGASVYAFKGTASYLGKKLTKAGVKGVQNTARIANQVVKKAPKAVQTVYKSARNRLTSLAQKGAEKLKRFEKNWLSSTARSIKQAANETSKGTFYNTLTSDLKMMAKNVAGELTAKKGVLEIIKDFSQNFTLAKLIEGGINNTFSNNVLKPAAVSFLGESLAKTASASPGPGPLARYKPAIPRTGAGWAGRPSVSKSPQTGRERTGAQAIPPRVADGHSKQNQTGPAQERRSGPGSAQTRHDAPQIIDLVRTGRGTYGCPAGYALQYWEKKCILRCRRPGERWNPSLKRCEASAASHDNCPTGQRYDPKFGTCVSKLTGCPSGMSWSPRQKKCLAVSRSKSCPANQHWSPRYRKCLPDQPPKTPGRQRVNLAGLPRHLPQENWPAGYVRHPKTPANTFFRDYPASKLPPGFSYSRTYLGGSLAINTHRSIESAEKAVQTFIHRAKAGPAGFGHSGAMQLKETTGGVQLKVTCRYHNVVFILTIKQHQLNNPLNKKERILVPKPPVSEVMSRAREWISAASAFAQKNLRYTSDTSIRRVHQRRGDGR